jgi:hypothetical protein
LFFLKIELKPKGFFLNDQGITKGLDFLFGVLHSAAFATTHRGTIPLPNTRSTEAIPLFLFLRFLSHPQRRSTQ